MLGLKIFVRVQTFWRRPFALSRNFCHPESDYPKSAPWQQLLAPIWLVPPHYHVSVPFVYCDYFKPAVSLLTSRLAYSSPSILFVLYDCKKREKWECFQRSRAVPTLWEEREREQVLPTQPPGWCPALGLRLRSSTPRGRSSVQTVSFFESYPKVFNYLASFIEGGNPSVTTLGHTKDNHSPEQCFFSTLQRYTKLYNMF